MTYEGDFVALEGPALSSVGRRGRSAWLEAGCRKKSQNPVRNYCPAIIRLKIKRRILKAMVFINTATHLKAGEDMMESGYPLQCDDKSPIGKAITDS
ncbi:hypothetical protein Zmor_010061 [Zophobas morio]|uniref:Uncharacterized protein n=1 Tax=Zophobas morio TaxID=2755281 RepID=A0AA38IQV9_9CUCU|nr:hypothetical protein Zmor_010061 [Zophobas morio]